MKSFVLALASLAACGGAAPSAPDAAPAPDATPVATVLFLQTEGETVTPGLDAPWNDTSSLVNATHTVPSLYAGDPDRATKIAAVVGEIRSILAPYDVDVVTARPAQGPYDMIVLGGAPSDLGLPATTGAIGNARCDGGFAMGFVFDATDGDTHDMSAAAISIFAFDHGVQYSHLAGDCMCAPFGSDTTCGHDTAACTIGGPDTPINPARACGGGTAMDEAKLFANAFGLR